MAAESSFECRGDSELELQFAFADWKRNHADCYLRIERRGVLEIELCGLVWLVETPVQNCWPNKWQSVGTCGPKILDVRAGVDRLKQLEGLIPIWSIGGVSNDSICSNTCHLERACETSVNSATNLGEMLDVLYRFSSLYSKTLLPDNSAVSRWHVVVDAELAADACSRARTAAAAAAEEEVEAGEGSNGENDMEIYGWSVCDELWVVTYLKEIFENLQSMSEADIVSGNVLKWCKIDVRIPFASFTCEIDVDKFLKGNETVLRTGVSCRKMLKITVSLIDGLNVRCSQEGVDSERSLGLAFLLPNLVKEDIQLALQAADCNNVVEKLLTRVITYLAFLSTTCDVCASAHGLGASSMPMSCNRDLCITCMEGWLGVVAPCHDGLSSGDGEYGKAVARREQWVRMKYPNSTEGRLEIGKRLNIKVWRNENLLQNEISYDEAVQRLARMDSTTPSE